MHLRDALSVLETIAPLRLAESWDNVGLLVGDPRQSVSGALLCIDYTPAVAREARDLGCDLVVAYHPPVFEALKRVTAPGLVFEAIRDGIALYAPHTALDVAPGGTNDVLADVLGIGERTPLQRGEARPTHHKLVTFVPEEHTEAVAAALFTAGAGKIGEYTEASFRAQGTGTFLGGEGTHPAVGQAGRREAVPEIRLEVLVPSARTMQAVAALRASHPYEEPAFDLVMLAPEPVTTGIGRIGDLLTPTPLGALLGRIKEGLGVEALLVSTPDGVGDETAIRRAAACAGACGKLFEQAMAQGAGLYLTGELRHHDALKAAQAGMTVVCALHSNSERATLGRVRSRLQEALPGLQVHLSASDHDPFMIR
ncbi:Nif3-like dinuclear metal center hexameric protein [Chondromyces apiculatus]|uniref:GTP cyclohydrolase 1 type 2 homolog n=1 Tax=Chondromyces apiculatus DSM 436 TaxID=1192034 RepID=A0A017TAQ2_9BACT|nr:Nif3-like dinuclear metal center hexameric protein [Chondromyces apiculatus]EYF06363.1 Hypothetical protein CAP_1893 [Chondromyces apiculatus DSM 436]